MQITYVWNNDQTLESYLDGIIADHTQTHIYNAGPEWEIGDLWYTDLNTVDHKLSQVESLVDLNPDVTDNFIYLRGCHSEVCDGMGQPVRLSRHNQELYARVEKIFGQKDLMWNFLLWLSIKSFITNPRFSVTDLWDMVPTQLLCFLQHRPHPHRISALRALCDTGLYHRGKCTFCNSDRAWQDFETLCLNSESDIMRNRSQDVVDRAHKLELHNSTTPAMDNTHSWDVVPDYPDYLFDIVVESNQYTNFFTEKTFKPIFWGKPFVILGSNSQNTILSNLGYETFPEYFDLTSDSDMIWDHNAVFCDSVTSHYHNIIEPISNISDHQIPEIFTEVRPKVQHNHSVMVKSLFDDQLIPDYVALPRHSQNPRVSISREYIDEIRSWFRHDEYFKQFV